MIEIRMLSLLIGSIVGSCLLDTVTGNGYMIDPPARSSMWRVGYDTPKNYNDMSINCGGFGVQWLENNGMCGLCGDPYNGERHHEAGGKYAKGIITRRYAQGQIIEITVKLTSSHGGWFEFRICPNNDVAKTISPDCLEMHLLGMAENNSQTRYHDIPTGGLLNPATLVISYQLPQELTCSHCVLQWKYNTGKDWRCDNEGNCAIGVGAQEQFVGCSDIAIGDGSANNRTVSTPRDNTTPTTAVSSKPTASTTKTTTGTVKTGGSVTAPKSNTTTVVTSKQTLTLSPIPTTTIPYCVNESDCEAIGVLRGTYDDECRRMCTPENMCLVAFCNTKCHQRRTWLIWCQTNTCLDQPC